MAWVARCVRGVRPFALEDEVNGGMGHWSGRLGFWLRWLCWHVLGTLAILRLKSLAEKLPKCAQRSLPSFSSGKGWPLDRSPISYSLQSIGIYLGTLYVTRYSVPTIHP